MLKSIFSVDTESAEKEEEKNYGDVLTKGVPAIVVIIIVLVSGALIWKFCPPGCCDPRLLP